MAVLSVKELIFRRECVFLQSVSSILQVIAAVSVPVALPWVRFSSGNHIFFPCRP